MNFSCVYFLVCIVRLRPEVYKNRWEKEGRERLSRLKDKKVSRSRYSTLSVAGGETGF